MLPREALVPWPAANTWSRPAVPPLAAAVNWSCATSMTQAPLPIGMPASVAVNLASSLPCAAAGPGIPASAIIAAPRKAARPKRERSAGTSDVLVGCVFMGHIDHAREAAAIGGAQYRASVGVE